MQRHKPTRTELVDVYSQPGATISSVARQYGVSQPTVRAWLIEYGIERKSHKQASTEANNRHRNTIKPDPLLLQQLHQQHSIDQLEQMFGVGQQTIYLWLESDGTECKTRQRACEIAKRKQHADKQHTADHIEQVHDRSKPIKHLADNLGVSYSHARLLLKRHGIPAPKVSRSNAEIALFDSCVQLAPSDQWSYCDRTVIAPLELDVVNHSRKLAFEYCGTYWHSEFYGNKTRNYHADKFNMCRQAGYKLVTIFESDDMQRVTSLIRSLLHLNEKVHARKTTVVQLSVEQARQFHQQHHLSGFAGAKYHYGLERAGDLLMAASFGTSRFNASYQYECVRMTSHSDKTVVGGASKLFSTFRERHQPAAMVTYADLRFGDGNVYNNCGMTFTEMTKPNYWYFHKNRPLQLFSRVKFQKHKLESQLEQYDSTLSEYQNMLLNGWDRIWDCGNAVYVQR
jgi:transposase-like protein